MQRSIFLTIATLAILLGSTSRRLEAAPADSRLAWVTVAFDNFLFPIGAVENGRWIPIEGSVTDETTPLRTIAPVVPIGMDFTAFPLRGAAARSYRVLRHEDGALFEGQYGVIGKSLGGDDLILVTAGQASMPRIPQALSRTSARYRAFLREALADSGMTVRNPRITQLLRIDLDDNGTDEVLLAGRSRADFSRGLEFGRRDYSVAFLRVVVGDQVRTVPLLLLVPGRGGEAELEGRLFETMEYIGVLDLNGDGRMEIVLKVSYYEGASYLVYEFDGNACRLVLAFGQGA